MNVRLPGGLAAALILAAAFVLAPPACRSNEPVPLSGPLRGVPGSLVYLPPHGEGRRIRVDTLQVGVVHVPGRWDGHSMASSPDGATIAVAASVAGGSDLFLLETRGMRARPLIVHERPGIMLTDPVWSPDGRSLYFTRRDLVTNTARIDRTDLAAGGRVTVVDNGFAPTLGAGGHLAYLAPTQTGRGRPYALWITDSDHRRRSRISGLSQFQLLAAPRFSPAGGWIAFAGVRAHPHDHDVPPSRPLAPRRFAGICLARAHDPVEWMLWRITPGGTALQQLSHIGEPAPSIPVWSPNRPWIAYAGRRGIQVIDLRSLRQSRLAIELPPLPEDFTAGLVWTPK